MHPPHEDMHRYTRNAGDPYNSPGAGGSAQGGLAALLIILVILGGLVIYSSLTTPSTDAPPAVDAEVRESITGAGATDTQ